MTFEPQRGEVIKTSNQMDDRRFGHESLRRRVAAQSIFHVVSWGDAPKLDYAAPSVRQMIFLKLFMAAFYEVMIERNFSSAHQLRGYKGKCENLHGHNYKIEIYARGSELNNIGLLIDFGDLKSAADEIVKYLDHRNINELPPFDEELNPSAENLARYFLEYVNGRIADDRVKVYKVRCFETPTSVATYQID